MSLQGKQVLIVDDAQDVRIIERKILENIGMSVTEATSVDDALTFLDHKIPHLIILDLEMPGKSGFEFLSFRLLTPTLKAVPVIVASAHNDKSFIYKALSLGANDYVLKPIRSTILGQRVRKQMRSIDYLSYTFPNDSLPEIDLHVKAQIIGIGEASLTLASPIRLTKNGSISLVPPEVRQVDLRNCVLMPVPSSGSRSMTGQYVSKVNVVGLKETLVKQMKKGES